MIIVPLSRTYTQVWSKKIIENTIKINYIIIRICNNGYIESLTNINTVEYLKCILNYK